MLKIHHYFRLYLILIVISIFSNNVMNLLLKFLSLIKTEHKLDNSHKSMTKNDVLVCEKLFCYL